MTFDREAALRWMTSWIDPILFFLAATSVPMLILEFGPSSDQDSLFIARISWWIWGAFAVNFVVRMMLTPDRRAQLHVLAFDLILIVGQPLYAIGDRQADAVFSFLRLLVIVGRALRKGRVLRRTGQKFRAQPLRVVAFLVPFIWLISAACITVTETDSGVISSFGDGLWWSAVTMATVGYGDISPKTTPGRGVATLTMVVGIGMFSLITAKLAEALFIQRTRGSRRETLEQDHTLILGWSPKVYTIVEQLAVANLSRPRATVVVLALRDHNDMLDDINAHVPGLARSSTTVVTRRGNPSDRADLVTCRPDRARSVIVIDDTEEDASVVRAVLALMHSGTDSLEVPVVAEINRPATADALRLALGDQINIVNPTAFIARTAAQACRTAGIAQAYEDLLDFEGSELYVKSVSGTTGRTFGSLLLAFDETCVVGVRDVKGITDLCPPMDRVVVEGEELVLVATDDSTIGTPVLSPPIGTTVIDPEPAEPLHVVIYGWNPLGPAILGALDGFVPPGSRFTIAADRSLAGPDLDLPRPTLVNAVPVIREAPDADYAALVQEVAAEDADHAMVLCYRNGLSVAEADAHALVTTLQVRHAFRARSGGTTVVTELLDQRDVDLAPAGDAGDFIVSDRLTSLLLAQLSESPHLGAVLDDLLDADGAELYCRPMRRYTLDEECTFGDLVLAAGRLGECAIGYRSDALSNDRTQSFGIVINPPKRTPMVPRFGDQLIVIADH